MENILNKVIYYFTSNRTGCMKKVLEIWQWSLISTKMWKKNYNNMNLGRFTAYKSNIEYAQYFVYPM